MVISRCTATDIKVAHRLILDHHSDVLAVITEFTNTGDCRLWVEQCNAPTIPLPAHYDKLLAFAGRWAMEFQRQPVDLFMGRYLRENRSGRTSHDAFPGVIVHPRDTSEASGPAYGFPAHYVTAPINLTVLRCYMPPALKIACRYCRSVFMAMWRPI